MQDLSTLTLEQLKDQLITPDYRGMTFKEHVLHELIFRAGQGIPWENSPI